MKGKWLFLACCIIGGVYFSDYWIFQLLIFIFYWIKNKDRSCYLCLFLLLVVNFLSKPIIIKPTSHIGRVIDLNSNSVILEVDKVKVIGYNFDQVILDDVFQFEGEFIEIESSPTSYGFDYEKWCHHNHIFYSVYASNIKRIDPSHSLRGTLQKKIAEADHEIKEFLMKTMFAASNESFGSLDELLVLSGTHISTFFQMLDSLLSLFCSRSDLISLILLIFTGSIFHFQFIYRRLIIQKILSFLKLDSKDKLGILILILVLMDVHCIYSTSFLFPMILKLIHCFDQNHDFIKRIISISFVQYLLNYQFNLIQIFLFSLLRKMIVLEIILAWISLFIPVSSAFVLETLCDLQKLIKTFESSLEFRGSLQLPIACFILFHLCSIRRSNQIKAYLIFGFVLLLNVNHWAASVNFINVGQGDSILIQLPFQQGNYLIDTGPASSYSNLKSFLYAKGVKEIKALFITHHDEDHDGNLNNLQQDFAIGQILDTKQEEYQDSVFSISFLLSEYQGNDENSNSLVLICEIQHMKFLFLGDITAKEEQLLIQANPALKADVVKLAHHGSATSTSEKLLDRIEAEYAIISCGLKNRYHHPSNEVMERLARYPIHVYSTAKEGDISFILTRFFNLICTSGKFLV